MSQVILEGIVKIMIAFLNKFIRKHKLVVKYSGDDDGVLKVTFNGRKLDIEEKDSNKEESK